MNKVTHVCFAASSQTAAFRLHQSLRIIGVESNIITGAKSINDKFLLQPETLLEKASALMGLIKEKVYRYFFYKNCPTYFSANIGPSFLQNYWLKHIYKAQSRIMHLHWIGNGFVPLKHLIRFESPIVWTMHDMWTITGGCHVTGICKKFETECGACPQIKSDRRHDITTAIFNRKKALYGKLNLTIIVPSRWMEQEAKKSPLLKGIKIHRIPNALDTSVFKPLDKISSRAALNLQTSKKVIAFGAISGGSDANKGFDLLSEALKVVLTQRDDILLLIFGGESSGETFGCESKYLGRLSDNVTLALVYSSADLVVVPSRQESFSQVSSESISCGTPVVAFDSTGPRDIIDHKENGYLAKPYDSVDLANGILWVLEDESRRVILSHNSRLKAINLFSYEVVAKQHDDLYNSLLGVDGI